MKTIQEIIDKYSSANYLPDNNKIMQLKYSVSSKSCQNMLREYGEEIFQQIEKRIKGRWDMALTEIKDIKAKML